MTIYIFEMTSMVRIWKRWPGVAAIGAAARRMAFSSWICAAPVPARPVISGPVPLSFRVWESGLWIL